jgi:hypothetical protein
MKYTLSDVVFDKRRKKSYFKPKYIPQLQIFSLSYHKNNVQNYINIIYSYHWHRKENHTWSSKSCYKNYTVHGCSDNIEITNCTTAKLNNKFTRLPSGCLRKVPEMEHEIFPTDYFRLCFYEPTKLRQY